MISPKWPLFEPSFAVVDQSKSLKWHSTFVFFFRVHQQGFLYLSSSLYLRKSIVSKFDLLEYFSLGAFSSSELHFLVWYIVSIATWQIWLKLHFVHQLASLLPFHFLRFIPSKSGFIFFFIHLYSLFFNQSHYAICLV